MSNLLLDLDLTDRCVIQALIEQELKIFKPYSKRCCSKEIPSDYEKVLLGLLKRVCPTREYVGEVKLSDREFWNNIGFKS